MIIPEMSMGGAQRSLAKISYELRKKHDVWVAVFNRNHTIAKAYQSDLLSLDVETGSGFLIKAKAFVFRVIRLRTLKKRLRIDVSISFLEGADYINVLSRIGDRVILSIRGSKLHDENMHRAGFSWRRRLIQYLYRRADTIVCVNYGIADEMLEYYSIKNVPIRTIYNFYDIEAIQHLANQQLPQAVQNLYSEQTLIMSGRLAREKGHYFVVQLFAELRKQHKKLRLILVGDGLETEPIIRFAESLDLIIAYTDNELSYRSNPDIYITGDQENVFSYLKRGTLYILNSSSEGFPNGLAEAMICGLPVLSADCPYGPREILCQTPQKRGLNDVEFADYGILLPVPGNSPDKAIFDKWFNSIHKMLDSEEFRSEYSKKGVNRIKNISSNKMIQQWYEVIEK
jgi:glycosyltransferase involved in cell wall biosynthesis